MQLFESLLVPGASEVAEEIHLRTEKTLAQCAKLLSLVPEHTDKH